ncbi:Tc toxin subunit A [Fulvivirga ulvae]|uniref:Tc toxin subunit A-related protein n=1 Tax=Fulvivirga ulvae TaxID=2904245 RepID=UPI001EECD66A|nr:neuraminidase-like domain-containing protein [Fulvivirga ulvae]UII33141.1 Tc toxin subunit A [Fulvivirga ulvae]
MKTTTNQDISSRLNLLHVELGKSKAIKEKFDTIYTERNGNWDAIIEDLESEEDFKPEIIAKLKFTYNLAEITHDNEKIIEIFRKDSKTNTLRDIAKNYGKEDLAKKIKAAKIETEEQTPEVIAKEIHTRLFHLEPTVTIARMLADPKETPVPNKTLSGNMATFLANQPDDFNIRNTSVYEAFKKENAFDNIPDSSRADVVSGLKDLQRVAAISPAPEVMPVLLETRMTSAYRISEMPEEQFVKTFSQKFGESGDVVARQLHNNAVNARIRNEQALIAMKEVGQGTGVDFIDKSLNISAPNNSADMTMMAMSINKDANYAESTVYNELQKHNLSWDMLFGDADFCECGECNSVYSAAAYFVDLLQYLRNNNIDANASGPVAIKPDPKDISNTPLEKLFNRRPDLGCLQLTCKNTNTILPYIDLVNEILENYLVYHHTKPFNVTENETSGELLAQPQHTEYEAYCILHKAVYPFSLPYHQPIDVARVYLDYLETSRHELIDTFRSPRKEKAPLVSDEENAEEEAPVFTNDEKEELDKLHTDYIDRAVDAEFLGITQEEYVILTKEAFISKEYWDKQCKKVHTADEYLTKIGAKAVHEYYGYGTEAEMLNADEGLKQGLTFVKDQFLRRTGIKYTDLVELLKTRCLNPNVPTGKALTIMESIGFSYRFLQSLVDNSSSTPKARYKKLIDFLNKYQPLIPLLEAVINPDPCGEKPDFCNDDKDFEKWVYCYFEKVGKIIVLENGAPCIDGKFIYEYNGSDNTYELVLAQIRNCQIIFIDEETGEEKVIGHIDKYTGEITLTDPDADASGWQLIKFVSSKGEKGKILEVNGKLYLVSENRNLPFAVSQADSCDLDTVRLIHLDGSAVTSEEYDHIHRFIRLWIKLGWTIDEVDKALLGLGKEKTTCPDDLMPDNDDCNNGCDDIFEESDGCSDCESDNEDCGCDDFEIADPVHCEITPKFLHQLVAVKKLLDITGLELIKLLTFWTDISISGEKSLYKRLFLSHNILGIDKVFLADKNGNYLTKNAKISDHVPVIMAAFNLSADDLNEIMEAEQIQDSLTLSNLSLIYRYRLLSKAIGLKIPYFISITPLFGNPFKSAHGTLTFTNRWEKMENAGFNYRQLNYIIRGYDDPQKPLTPSDKVILQLAKTLYDGLNGIDTAHPDMMDDEEVTTDIVRAKSILLFPQTIVEQIAGIIEGTNVFTTNAPKNLVFTIDDSKSLKNKLVYDAEGGRIQVTGILTLAEKTDYQALSNDPEWAKSLARIEKQQDKLFKEALGGVFEEEKQKSPEYKIIVEEAEAILKSGDIMIPLEQIPDGQEDPGTAPEKSRAFMKIFLPYLRAKLTHLFVIETLSQSSGLKPDVTNVLVSDVLTSGTPAAPIYNIFEAIKESSKPADNNWSGYLIPSKSDNFTIIIKESDDSPGVSIDGASISFTQQEDPTNEWWGDAVKLQAGKLYKLQVTGLDLKHVYWKTPTSAIENIPPAMLLPDFTTSYCKEAYIKLQKAAIIASVFEVEAEEFSYLDENKADFDGLDFNSLTLKQWLRLEAYVRLRNSLPETETTLIDFFKWAHFPEDATLLSSKIEELTTWKKSSIEKLIAEDHFEIDNPDAFYNEINLLKLQKALEVADKIGMDIDLLFDWAKPTSNFKKCRKIADSIQHSLRAKYRQEDWEQVVKPLNDTIRNHQQSALIAYLLQQPELIAWGVEDADGLFEYFLIDVQMDACMETSRIKQALSSTQLFIQRCFLGLEEEHNGITPDILDRDRWEWMQRYRVWEANRKVFLYPENWIESNLRDDKSPFFKELEGELLQNDINKENVENALKSYLFKVDEVANMEVVGLYIDGTKNPDGQWMEESKLHIFSRTRNAPYLFYYRYLALDQMNWYPWTKVDMDIPSYDVEDSENKIIGNGCYLIPVVWNGRLIIFFPQIIKKTEPVNRTIKIGSESERQLTPEELSKYPMSEGATSEFLEIKLGMSELKNNKWTQKKLSKNAVYDFGTTTKSQTTGSTTIKETQKFSPDLRKYSFVSKSQTDYIEIGVYGVNKNRVNTFNFDGDKITVPLATSLPGSLPALPIDFHYTTSTLYSMQVSGSQLTYFGIDPAVSLTNSFSMAQYYDLYHAFTKKLFTYLNKGQLQGFFNYNLNPVIDKQKAYGGNNGTYHELKRPYSLYNWELFFHTPLMLADALSKAQHYEEAMKWYHYVFNPMAKGSDDKRFWQFSPFKEINTQDILDQIFSNLKPNTADQAITEWRNDPFKPHLVARSRPVAYMKWVVMKYIDNLVQWGDYLFRQDTIETINQATQLYVLGYHILGKRPQMIPKRGKIKPQTYNSLLGKWDAFSNAMVELEIALPFSNQTTLPVGIDNGVVGFANIFGFASTLYFCIPNNPKLIGYWDIIEDRLYKIRHCLNIEGVFRNLPLFEPPIDPALLVKAAAQGLSIASVLNDLNTPMPNYRFYYLLQKSLELCGELKGLGGAMLSSLEKKEGEMLSLIRAKHESTMQNMIMEIKKKQLEESEKALESLGQNRKSPEHRMRYYLQLIGEDVAKVPGFETDFTELANTIEKPVDESGLKLIKYEKEDMDKASEANSKQKEAELPEKIASILHIIPSFSVDAKPIGIGAGVSFGGSNLGAAAQAYAKFITSGVSDLSFQSAKATKKSGFLRSLQDRIMQANAAGLEIKQIDKQMLSQQIRIDIARKEILNQQKLIDHNQEIEEFIKNKYTNDELYTWMKGSLRTLYYQVYSLAYELGKKAEKVFRFERGLTNSDFIQPGYWEAGRDGLLAGEKLYVGLKQLEAAYQEQKGYDYEVTKHISLRNLNPIALIQLKETGKCEFALPEVLFDMDYPGHYKRRIKSVSMSIPCIVGPYTGLNASLRLLENKFRNSAIAKDKNDYIEKTEETDERFNTFNIPVTAIAASSAQNESGMFELNFKDERYLPFEGAGVISKWRVELPNFRQFDYDTISDVIVHMKYTSSEGGELMKKAAFESVIDFNKNNEEIGQQEGLFSIIDLKHDLSNEWYKTMQVNEGDTERVLTINKLTDYLPYYVRLDKDGKPRDPKNIKITDLILTASTDLQASDLAVAQDEEEISFTEGVKIGDTKTFAIRDEEIKAESIQLIIKNVDKEISKALLVVRFILK